MTAPIFCPDSLDFGTVSDWASVLCTVAAAAIAVLGSFKLWNNQLKKRSDSLEATAVAIFRNVYDRLIEFEAFTNFDEWRRYAGNVNGGLIATDEAAWKAHKEAVLSAISAHLVSLDLALKNFEAIQGNLYDVSRERIETMLRLHGFIGGAPSQIRRIQSFWAEADRGMGPVVLPEEFRYVLSRGIAGGAYFLNKLDSAGRKRAQDFEPIEDELRRLHREHG
jgi:hypothetical protein